MADYTPDLHARGEHVSLETDLLAIATATLAFLLHRWIILRIVVRPFALQMMGCEAKSLDTPTSLGVEKFCKYGWHFIAYTALLCWGIKILAQSEWSVLSSGRFEDVCLGYPHSGREKAPLKAFFIAQISWYIQGFVESLMVDRLRSDFALMLVHHCLAIALLCGAFWGNAHRIGVTVCVFQVRNFKA